MHLLKLTHSQIFPHIVSGTKNNTKNNKKALQPLRVQRIDDVVCMVIESCILFDCGNTRIGKITEGTRNQTKFYIPRN